MAVEDITTPQDVSCMDLDALRAQSGELGHVVVNSRRPLTAARQAIVESISPSGLIRFKDPGQVNPVVVPQVDDPFHQKMIIETRIEAERSECWWRKVGCVVANPENGEIIAKTHNLLPPGGNFCRGLEADPQQVTKLLGDGEKLEFCPARHAENVMEPLVRRMGLLVESMDLGISLEPCDHCAYLLSDLRPKGVYIDFGHNKKYYSSLGIRILQLAGVPVYFVRMPEDGST